MKTKLKLVVMRRTYDWHCSLQNHPEVWDCGRTKLEAIGKWLLTHGNDYGIELIT